MKYKDNEGNLNFCIIILRLLVKEGIVNIDEANAATQLLTTQYERKKEAA